MSKEEAKTNTTSKPLEKVVNVNSPESTKNYSNRIGDINIKGQKDSSEGQYAKPFINEVIQTTGGGNTQTSTDQNSAE